MYIFIQFFMYRQLSIHARYWADWGCYITTCAITRVSNHQIYRICIIFGNHKLYLNGKRGANRIILITTPQNLYASHQISISNNIPWDTLQNTKLNISLSPTKWKILVLLCVRWYKWSLKCTPTLDTELSNIFYYFCESQRVDLGDNYYWAINILFVHDNNAS